MHSFYRPCPSTLRTLSFWEPESENPTAEWSLKQYHKVYLSPWDHIISILASRHSTATAQYTLQHLVILSSSFRSCPLPFKTPTFLLRFSCSLFHYLIGGSWREAWVHWRSTRYDTKHTAQLGSNLDSNLRIPAEKTESRSLYQVAFTRYRVLWFPPLRKSGQIRSVHVFGFHHQVTTPRLNNL